MRYAAAAYVGTGTDADPYRPEGVDGLEAWTSIDFRPDSTRPEGFCLIAVADDAPVKGATFLADGKAETLDTRTRTTFSNRVGLNVDAVRLDDVVLELLTAHATPDGDRSRWNPIKATSDGRLEAWLGDEKIVDLPSVRGGAVRTESFNKANSTTLGPDLTWTDVAGTGDLWVQSNACENVNNNTGIITRAEHDLATSDNYAQFVILYVGANHGYGPACRYQSGADTCYFGRQGDDGGNINNTAIFKRVTGTNTSLGTSSRTAAVNDVVRCQANGSSIALVVNGTSHLALTDTAITTGLRGGMRIYKAGSGTNPSLDSFEMGDLGGAVRPPRERLGVALHRASIR